MPGRTQLPYGEGIYRRRLRFVCSGRSAVGEMEDDFHHFRVRVEHDHARVLQVLGESVRFPWTECPGAAEPLRELEGVALFSRSTEVSRNTDVRSQCTHMFDIAGLTIAQIAAQRALREYDIAIPDRTGKTTRATLRRDDGLVFDWGFARDSLAAPVEVAGVALRGSEFARWAYSTLGEDRAEAAFVLRRAVQIALGRTRNLDDADTPAAYLPNAVGSCHAFAEGTASRAQRIQGATLEFTHTPEALLSVRTT
jgi:hypothetical protein